MKCSLKVTIGFLVLLGCGATATIAAADHFAVNPAIVESPAGVIGEVIVVEYDDRTLLVTVKLESRETVVIIVDQATEVKRVPAGERSIENALAIEAGEIAPGDRVYARGARPDGSGTARARQLIVLWRASVDEKTDEQGTA